MKYITKLVEIEAIEWKGVENTTEILDWSQGKVDVVIGAIPSPKLSIKTLEGVMEASLGDFIIKGLKGEFYSCKPDIFKMKYELLTPTKLE